MFLRCFYLCHFLSFFSLFLSIIVSSSVVHFPRIWTQTMVVLSNVLWSSGKFFECPFWAGTEGTAKQRDLVLEVCLPGNHRSWTGRLYAISHGISQNWLVFTSIKQLDLLPKFHHFGTIVLVSISFSSACSWIWLSNKEQSLFHDHSELPSYVITDVCIFRNIWHYLLLPISFSRLLPPSSSSSSSFFHSSLFLFLFFLIHHPQVDGLLTHGFGFSWNLWTVLFLYVSKITCHPL